MFFLCRALSWACTTPNLILANNSCGGQQLSYFYFQWTVVRAYSSLAEQCVRPGFDSGFGPFWLRVIPLCLPLSPVAIPVNKGKNVSKKITLELSAVCVYPSRWMKTEIEEPLASMWTSILEGRDKIKGQQVVWCSAVEMSAKVYRCPWSDKTPYQHWD